MVNRNFVVKTKLTNYRRALRIVAPEYVGLGGIKPQILDGFLRRPPHRVLTMAVNPNLVRTGIMRIRSKVSARLSTISRAFLAVLKRER